MKSAVKKCKYKIISLDPDLKPFADDIELRMQLHAKTRQALLGEKGDLSAFANGYLYFGFHKTQDGWIYREWAPGADAMHLIGDFNEWNRTSHPMKKLDGGVWEITLDGYDALRPGQRVKVQVTRGNESFDRIPAYIRRVIQDPLTHQFCGQIEQTSLFFRWTDQAHRRKKPNPLFIYETHIGMAQEREGVGSYREFADNNLKYIKDAGYNTIQLMAIQEHPYYASFGYQVTNFYAPSSWFGEPEDLKYLVNKAHEMGLFVLLDLVHSHANANVGEGLNMFDGTEDQYFLPGQKGWHPAWGTKLFDYSRHEVLHFLLSNLKYWMEEYHFDGFRFDGVTSMLYHDHGLGKAFTGYHDYFSLNTDVSAVTYLQLANELIHAVNPFAITIAEDMSGMPGMCLPIRYGGLGFDYRLSMGVPDFWIKILKESRDENWDMHKLWYELTSRRPQEKNVCYCESHDQALVGDKTLIFRMADAEMYTGMDKNYHSPSIDRAIALHKMIRFITLTLAGEGYLNFMGNEFGHPEWIDFPREGNGWSYKYARRQWSLVNGYLKYEWLKAFDGAMLSFAKKRRVMCKKEPRNLWIGPEDKIIAFEKGDLVYVFNFHPEKSQEGFFINLGEGAQGEYQCVFSSDDAQFGGQSRIDTRAVLPVKFIDGKGTGFQIYIPCRTAAVYERIRKK